MEQENRFKVVGKGGKMLFAGNIKECQAYLEAYHQALATHTKMKTNYVFFGEDRVWEEIDGNKYTLCEVKPFDPEPWVLTSMYFPKLTAEASMQLDSVLLSIYEGDDKKAVALSRDALKKLISKLAEFEQHLKDTGE